MSAVLTHPLGLRRQMRLHLNELCEEYKVTIEYGFKSEETVARLHWRERLIEMPEVRTRADYFAGLHEFGHLVLDHRSQLMQDHVNHLDSTLVCEAEANLWALDHAIVAPTLSVWQQIEGCLADYTHFRGHDPNLIPEDRCGPWDRLRQVIDEAYAAAMVTA